MYLFLSHVISLLFLMRYILVADAGAAAATDRDANVDTTVSNNRPAADNSSLARESNRPLALPVEYQRTYPKRYHTLLILMTNSVDFLSYPILKSMYHILGYLMFFDTILNHFSSKAQLPFAIHHFFRFLIFPSGLSSVLPSGFSAESFENFHSAGTLINCYLLECLIYWDFIIYGVLIALSFYPAFKYLLAPFIEEYYFSAGLNNPREAPGLSLEQINLIPTLIYKRPLVKRLFDSMRWMAKITGSQYSSTASNDTCAICFDSFRHLDVQRKFPCQHLFHKDCVDPWLQRCSFCPLCKRVIRPVVESKVL